MGGAWRRAAENGRLGVAAMTRGSETRLVMKSESGGDEKGEMDVWI